LKTPEQIEALKSGKIDIGFGRIRIDDPEVEQKVLFNEPLVAALPRAHPLTLQVPNLQQLSEIPMVAFPAGTGPSFADMTLGLFHREVLQIEVIQQVNDLQTALALVASGMGFALVPEQVKKLQREGVEYVSVADDNIRTPVISSRRCDDNPNAV